MQLKDSFRIDLDSYRSAKDLFEAAREAARDAECIVKQIQSMELFEDVKTQQYGSVVSSKKAIADRMILTDKRLDYEDMTRRRLEEDHALIDAAVTIIYGYDGCRGIRHSLGNSYANVLWWRYLRNAKWNDVAAAVGCGKTWCCQAREIAFDVIDSVGFIAAAAGLSPISKT